MSQYNDTQFEFLRNLGYQGALNDMWVRYWLDQISPPPWILETTLWNDLGAWRDTSVWQD